MHSVMLLREMEKEARGCASMWQGKCNLPRTRIFTFNFRPWEQTQFRFHNDRWNVWEFKTISPSTFSLSIVQSMNYENSFLYFQLKLPFISPKMGKAEKLYSREFTSNSSVIIFLLIFTSRNFFLPRRLHAVSNIREKKKKFYYFRTFCFFFTSYEVI